MTYQLPEPAAHMFSDDLEKFQSNETFAHAYSVAVGSPGQTEPMFTAAQMQAAYAAGFAAAAAVPDGWKLVPVEPTNFQIIKGENALHSISHGDFHATQAEIESCYVAMIAAAPEPKP